MLDLEDILISLLNRSTGFHLSNSIYFRFKIHRAEYFFFSIHGLFLRTYTFFCIEVITVTMPNKINYRTDGE